MGTPFPITCGSPLAPIDGVPRSSLILAGTALVVAALYFARAILLPVALATVLAFVLSPIVGLLRRWGLGRVPAALLVVLLLFSVLGATTWILASQVMTVLSDVPGYADTIKTKVAALRRMGKGTTLDRARGALNEVVNEMEKDAQPPPAGRAPLPVVVKPSPAPLSGRLPVLLEPLATAGLVLLLVIFMLLERQELRNRFLRILGAGRLTLTTRALDEASARISRFLGTQLAINGTLGVIFGLGLLALGVPYPFLWGALLALARFVPFAGVWAAVVPPTLLSLAVFDSWMRPALVVGFFVMLELIVAVIVEPMLLSQRAGVSKVAMVGALAFWTWLWGPAGLILAMPLTVCLIVLTRHVPELEFIAVLLSDGPALPPRLVFYQRLVAKDQDEAAEIVEEQLKAASPERVWDEVVIPALAQARRDQARGAIGAEEARFVITATREIIEELAPPPSSESVGAEARPVSVLGCPVGDPAAEIALVLLRQLLNPAVVNLDIAPAALLPSEIVEHVERAQPSVICLALPAPGGIARTRYLLKRIRACCPQAKILVGRWGGVEDSTEQRRLLAEAGADGVATPLAEARDQLLALVPIMSPSEPPASVATGLQTRVA